MNLFYSIYNILEMSGEFLKSTLFYNPNITEGRQLELTVFGKLLTISSLPYESPLIQTEFRFATEAAAAVG